MSKLIYSIVGSIIRIALVVCIIWAASMKEITQDTAFICITLIVIASYMSDISETLQEKSNVKKG